MAEPTPETAEDALKTLREALTTLRRAPKGETPDQARRRSCEQVDVRRRLDALSRKAANTAAVAAARSKTNGHASASADGSKPGGGKRTGITAAGANALARGLMGWLGPELKTIDKRLAELEATQLTDGGTWNSDKVFKPNELATYKGAIWICLEANKNTRPGDHNSCWRLMHKTIGLGK